MVLKDANGNPIDTAGWTASQLSEARSWLMESGSTDYQQIDQLFLMTKITGNIASLA